MVVVFPIIQNVLTNVYTCRIRCGDCDIDTMAEIPEWESMEKSMELLLHREWDNMAAIAEGKRCSHIRQHGFPYDNPKFYT